LFDGAGVEEGFLKRGSFLLSLSLDIFLSSLFSFSRGKRERKSVLLRGKRGKKRGLGSS
jgi:hypothetical protein